MRRLLVVANPSASGFAASAHREVVEILSAGYEVDAAWPRGPGEARRAAARAAGKADVVVAMGGDGVVHQVANAIAGTPTSLAVLAVGTTNVVSRLLGMPRAWRDAAEAIAAAATTRPFPTVTIACDGRAEEIAVFAAGIGFDADVIAESERQPHRKLSAGALHYARSALRVARAYRRALPTLRVSSLDHRGDAVGVQIQVHDRLTFLGPVPLRLGTGPRPLAAVIGRVTPGRLAATVLRAAARREVAAARTIEVWRGFSKITVEADPPALTQADGEVLGPAHTITIRPGNKTLLVLDTA